MKTLQLSIIGAVVIIALGSNTSFGMLVAKTPEDLYRESDVILIGKITIAQGNAEQRVTDYTITIEKYLKNDLNEQTLQITSSGCRGCNLQVEDEPIFDTGDRVLLYLYKEDGKYKISPYSFIAPESCDKHQLLELPIIPGEPIGRGSPPGGYVRLTDREGNDVVRHSVSNDLVLSNNEIFINYDAWNNYKTFRDIDIEITITRGSEIFPVFHEKHTLYNMEPCTGHLVEKWAFTPPKAGTYTVQVTFDEGTSTYSFEARQNLLGVSLDKTVYPLSPLQQFKSGVLLTNIKCKDGFQLMIKSVNGLPVCVITQTAKKLGERGWGKDLSTILLEIPLPKISQTQAIKTVENDLKNHVKDSTKILRIVDTIGNQDRYIPFSEFQTDNKTLPLVFVSTNGTLLTINNASLRINGWCNMGTYTYCGYLPPFNLDYKSRLVYGLDIIYGDNETNMEPAFYGVDATSGEIIDSSFLRIEAREK